LVADACRLYVTRPGAGSGTDRYREFAQSFITLNLSFLFYERARLAGEGWSSGPDAVQLESVTVEPATSTVSCKGTVQFSRVGGTETLTRTQRFELNCPVPSHAKTPRGVVPLLRILEVERGTA
jgi:hypothetical protein